MTLFKKVRLLFWLLKAYVKKSYRMLLLSFLVGLLLFILVVTNINTIVSKIPLRQKRTIGIVGAYTVDTIPQSILTKLSRGLTMLGDDGLPNVDIARDYRIRDDGKTYDILIKRNIFFSDGKELTVKDINPGFSDVAIERPIPYRIIFKLKDSYAPFMVSLTHPILKNDLVGLGDYTLSDIHLNGNFVESLALSSRLDPKSSLQYLFYPTEDAVKTAFVLGEVDEIDNLPNAQFNSTTFQKFSNAAVTKKTDYGNLVTLFYNLKDKDIENTRLREAFSYAIPDVFSEGQRSYTPFAPAAWVSKDTQFGNQKDLEHAKILLAPVVSGTKNQTLSFTLKTLPEYEDVAKKIAAEWKKIGILLKIEKTDKIPTDFQLFLGKFTIPKDPDQYTLWHSGQRNNITGYNNKRIDQLLEDGRKTVDLTERKKIYSDFQKYLLSDPPATFLFFPYTYKISRK